MMKNNVLYSAVVLDDKSRTTLIKHFEDLIPEDWDVIAHHMTINLGEINPRYEKLLDRNVRLKVNDLAFDEKVIAVGVDGFPSKNKKPHITIAVNRANGGKPVMSNNLTNWTRISDNIILNGVVTEVTKKIIDE